MSLLNHLQLQPIDASDEVSNSDDEIALSEPVDENKLDKFWDKVVDDIHQDPDWFNFSDE